MFHPEKWNLTRWLSKKNKSDADVLSSGVDHSDQEINQAIFHALTYLNLDLLQRLLEEGADPNVSNDAEETPLIICCKHGLLSYVKVLLQFHPDLNKQDNAGNTALMWAVQEADREIVELLLSNGVNIELTNKQGNTAESLAMGYYNQIGEDIKLHKQSLWISSLKGLSMIHPMSEKHKLPAQKTVRNHFSEIYWQIHDYKHQLNKNVNKNIELKSDKPASTIDGSQHLSLCIPDSLSRDRCKQIKNKLQIQQEKDETPNVQEKPSKRS